ncbi:MAG: winged helix-turn-helix domain-containing protein [Thiohalocapsa sp.]
MLHRLGYEYKKPKLVPGKADAERQEAFVADYNKRKETNGADDVALFMETTHPQYNPALGCGWIKRGEQRHLESNTALRRLNINGAIDIATMSAQVRFDEKIDGRRECLMPLRARLQITCADGAAISLAFAKRRGAHS